MSTNNNKTQVLIIEDEPDLARILQRIVNATEGYQASVINDPLEALDEINRIGAELIFTDLMMPGMGGIELIEQVKSIDSDLPIVVISAYSTLENAVAAVKAGAFDFLPKPFTPESVDLILTKLQRDIALRKRADEICRNIQSSDPYLQPLIGDSTSMQKLCRWICKVRGSKTSILIEGESGTGKELVARAIHAGKGPFVALNMAAIPDELAEAELFGIRKGAFTGANENRDGFLVEANGGTLFLDEVNGMSHQIQTKLLRALQERQIRPLGGGNKIDLDFQLISASNQNLKQLIEQGHFRRDLYYRLNVLSIVIPPLRDRRNDISKLAEHFLHRYARAHKRQVRKISPLVINKLINGEWPGNIRELENVIEQAVILSTEDASEVSINTLPESLGGLGGLAEGIDSNQASNNQATLAAIEWQYILQVLNDCNGNKAATSRVLGIDYKTLLRKLNSRRKML